MTSARTIARPLTQCPYCDHVSPEDSKFCNECGAALHLKPCPHCGSLNDVTQTEVCARCHGSLSEEEPPGAANDSIITVEHPSEELELAPAPRRLLAPVTGALALGLLAAGGYYGYESWQPPAPAVTPLVTPEPVQARPAPPPVSPPASIAPTIARTPEREPEPEPAAAAALLPATERAALPVPRPPARALVRPAPAKAATGNPDIEPRIPALGPCTAAVAALGLCSNSSSNDSSANNNDNRRQ